MWKNREIFAQKWINIRFLKILAFIYHLLYNHNFFFGCFHTKVMRKIKSHTFPNILADIFIYFCTILFADVQYTIKLLHSNWELNRFKKSGYFFSEKFSKCILIYYLLLDNQIKSRVIFSKVRPGLKFILLCFTYVFNYDHPKIIVWRRTSKIVSFCKFLQHDYFFVYWTYA